MLDNWILIKPNNQKIFCNNLQYTNNIEYFNSFIYQMYNKMVYKIINGEIVICKPNTMMGNYNFIRYCNTNNSEHAPRDTHPGKNGYFIFISLLF